MKVHLYSWDVKFILRGQKSFLMLTLIQSEFSPLAISTKLIAVFICPKQPV